MEAAPTQQTSQELLELGENALRELRRLLDACSGPLPAHLAPLRQGSQKTLFEVGPRSTQQTTLGLMVDDGGGISGVMPGAPAARSHQIALGDRIVSIDGRAVGAVQKSADISAQLLGSDTAGSKVQLRLRQRDNSERDVVLERMPVFSIHHRKRLFEIFCILRGESFQLQAPVPSASPEGAAGRYPAAGQNDPVTPDRPRTPTPAPGEPPSKFTSPAPHRSPSAPAADQTRSLLAKAAVEGVELWTLMVEEEDTRADMVKTGLEAGVHRLQDVLGRLASVVQRERETLSSCIEAQQTELSELSDALRNASATTAELRSKLMQAERDAMRSQADTDSETGATGEGFSTDALQRKGAPPHPSLMYKVVDSSLRTACRLVCLKYNFRTASLVTAFHFAAPRPQRSATPAVHWASDPSASHSSADIDRATDLVELDFLRKQVAEHEEEMQRCRVAHLMEMDFLRQQVAEKGEEMQRCAADLAELDFLRKRVTEKEEEMQRCRAEVQRLVKTDKVQVPEHLSQQPARLATEQEDPFSLVNFDGEVLADAEYARRTGSVKAADGSGSGDSETSNPRLESPKANLCAVKLKQRQHALRSARNEPPMKQTSQVPELGVIGRGLSHCQAMWALAQEERVRPLMLVNGLFGVFALIWVMFFMSWGGQRRFVAGIQ